MKKIIPNFVPTYNTDMALYTFASKFWDWKVNKFSLSRAIRRALQEPDCPESPDPFESLVDAKLYANPMACGQRLVVSERTYVDIPWLKPRDSNKISVYKTVFHAHDKLDDLVISGKIPLAIKDEETSRDLYKAIDLLKSFLENM